ncbi:hypothetical protein [Shewanella pealeana]|uniref:Uncharacterized protein n=1 Tax=Shewanella pealeana (strain ATCC 700345 / ANG-SQ1) TaxID=398579 RepID=A8HA25_SHEPA|nr:hypothetical protein [Shewanella pealeana]ABV89412.1 hypothetical protein Spea_4102 [Shewanella pealeana ATCC 700345]
MKMYKVIKIAAAILLLNCLQASVSAEEGSFGLDGVFVYKDMVGGPYFDEWYLDGNLNNLNDLKLYREGKSGSLETSIKIDCKREAITIHGAGLLFGSMALTKEETQEYLPKDLSEAIVRKICTLQPNI